MSCSTTRSPTTHPGAVDGGSPAGAWAGLGLLLLVQLVGAPCRPQRHRRLPHWGLVRWAFTWFGHPGVAFTGTKVVVGAGRSAVVATLGWFTRAAIVGHHGQLALLAGGVAAAVPAVWIVVVGLATLALLASSSSWSRRLDGRAGPDRVRRHRGRPRCARAAAVALTGPARPTGGRPGAELTVACAGAGQRYNWEERANQRRRRGRASTISRKLQRAPGHRPVLTRKRDTFIPDLSIEGDEDVDHDNKQVSQRSAGPDRRNDRLSKRVAIYKADTWHVDDGVASAESGRPLRSGAAPVVVRPPSTSLRASASTT